MLAVCSKFCQWSPQPLYQASSVLRVEWSHPHLRDLVGDRAKIDSGERVEAMSDLIGRSRAVIQAALHGLDRW